MALFTYEQISGLNSGEFRVYNFVSTHMREASEMNIRELAGAAEVSTTTVLRFCGKIGCDGYTEFKYRIRKNLEEEDAGNRGVNNLTGAVPAIQYLQKASESSELGKKLDDAAKILIEAGRIFVMGIGTSGYLAGYGAHFFTSTGLDASVMMDMFYPLPKVGTEIPAVLVLSVSGETDPMIHQIDGCRKRGAKIISITNTDQCTVAKMSDINFPYYMPLAYSIQDSGIRTALTTQIPVVFLLEALTGKIYERLKKK